MDKAFLRSWMDKLVRGGKPAVEQVSFDAVLPGIWGMLVGPGSYFAYPMRLLNIDSGQYARFGAFVVAHEAAHALLHGRMAPHYCEVEANYVALLVCTDLNVPISPQIFADIPASTLTCRILPERHETVMAAVEQICDTYRVTLLEPRANMSPGWSTSENSSKYRLPTASLSPSLPPIAAWLLDGV